MAGGGTRRLIHELVKQTVLRELCRSVVAKRELQTPQSCQCKQQSWDFAMSSRCDASRQSAQL